LRFRFSATPLALRTTFARGTRHLRTTAPPHPHPRTRACCLQHCCLPRHAPAARFTHLCRFTRATCHTPGVHTRRTASTTRRCAGPHAHPGSFRGICEGHTDPQNILTRAAAPSGSYQWIRAEACATCAMAPHTPTSTTYASPLLPSFFPHLHLHHYLWRAGSFFSTRFRLTLIRHHLTCGGSFEPPLRIWRVHHTRSTH